MLGLTPGLTSCEVGHGQKCLLLPGRAVQKGIPGNNVFGTTIAATKHDNGPKWIGSQIYLLVMNTGPNKIQLTPAQIDSFVDIVAQARKRSQQDTAILNELRNAGAREEDAKDLLTRITHGLRSGVQFAITGGASEPGMAPGTCPIYDAAFKAGQSAFTGVLRKNWIKRIALLLFTAAAITIFGYLVTSG